MEKQITEEQILKAATTPRGLGHTLGRWQRSKKTWFDEQTLVNDVVAYFDASDADATTRLAVRHTAKRVAAKVPHQD